MQNLKELKKHIVSNINPNWSNLEKIRYVYLESGKYLQKHTEFFLTVDDKLTETKLPPKKLDKIYKGRLNSDEWNKMLCKTGAEFVKDVLSILGIESQLVETVNYTKIKGMKNHLHHFFLCVNTGEYNIFLTPAADYSNIQNGFCTLRFGSEISYMVDGEQFYKSPFEIPHKVLSRKDMKELDDKIGYTIKVKKESKKGEAIETFYLDEIIKKNKSDYDDFLAMNTDFYNGIFPEDESKRKITNITERKNNWNDIINYVCTEVGNKISQITKTEYNYSMYVNRQNFDIWFTYIESMFDKSKYNTNELFYSNPNLIINKARNFCLLIINFCKKNSREITKEDCINFRNRYVKQVLDISKHFIDEKYVIEPKNGDDYVSNVYLNHKFSTYFPEVMGANSGFIERINTEGYSEQIEYVKRAIELMFSDLGKKNLLKNKDEDLKIPPIFKRINLYTYRNKRRDEYGTYIAISDSDSNSSNSIYWYKYNLADNIFKRTTLARVAIECSSIGTNEIISNRLKRVINNIEDIEEAGNTGHLRMVLK